MRTLIAFALTTTLLLGGTTSLRAQPTGLTTNESVIIISIDGNLLDVPTATERDRIVVEIPERTKWRVLRGDYRKGVGDETVVLSFSIPAGHIPTVTRDHERSRLLIGFVRDGALASTPASVTTPSTPSAQPSSPASAREAPPSNLSRALLQRLSAANVDLAVPESPAFAVLGITPQSVTRPTSPRSFATSLLNGLDEKGNFQAGLAIDVAPYLLLAGPALTLEDYQRNRFIRFLSRTNLSLGTTKGATNNDLSLKLALGLHFTLVDDGDPRLDSVLLADINNVLSEQPPFTPEEIKRAQVLKQQGKTDAEIFPDRIERIRAALEPFRENARKRNWNATSWVVGLAPSWISTSGNTDDFKGSGGGIWTSYAYGFKGIKGLQDNSQLTLHLRYLEDQLVPDPAKDGHFLREDSLLLAGQFRGGWPNLNVFLSTAYIHAKSAGHSGDAFRPSVGLEYQIASDLWLNLSLGHEFGDTLASDRTFVLGSFRLGASSKPSYTVAP